MSARSSTSWWSAAARAESTPAWKAAWSLAASSASLYSALLAGQRGAGQAPVEGDEFGVGHGAFRG